MNRKLADRIEARRVASLPRDVRLLGELRALHPGCTRVVFGVVVTRWALDVYEVDTWTFRPSRWLTRMEAHRLITDRLAVLESSTGAT